MVSPNYFHVGQPKAGSTSLHFSLNSHFDIWTPPRTCWGARRERQCGLKGDRRAYV